MSGYSRQGYLIHDLPLAPCLGHDGWYIQRIGTMAEVVGGGTPETATPSFWNPPDVPWATPTDITKSSGIFIQDTERKISREGLAKSSAVLLPAHSSLLTSRATIGECRINTVPMATNQGFTSLIPRDDIDPLFLFYLTYHLKQVLVRLAAGTTYTEVSRSEVRKIRCLVPKSIEEQAAIAQAIYAVDQSIEHTENELESARRLKKSLLQQIFTNGLPGQHYSMCYGQVFKSRFSYPSQWKLEKIGKLLTSVDYGTNSPGNEYQQGYPIIAIPQVVSSSITRGDWPYADLGEEEARQLRLEAGDVLLIRTNGNPEYIGKSTVISEEIADEHIVFASYLLRARANQDLLLGPYLNLFLASPLGRRQCLALANTSAGNHNLGARSLRSIIFPRPPLEYQREALSLIRSAETLINAAEQKHVALSRLKISLLQNLLTARVRLRKDAAGLQIDEGTERALSQAMG